MFIVFLKIFLATHLFGPTLILGTLEYNFLLTCLQLSYEILATFLGLAYDFHTIFLPFSMTFLQSFYNFLITPLKLACDLPKGPSIDDVIPIFQFFYPLPPPVTSVIP